MTVWAIIRDVCNSVGIPIPTIRELDKLLDDKTYKIYEDGLTCTINQADSDFATELVKQYKPHSVAEMSAFVAIIRPGCASLLQDFIDRKDYTTGVKELDDILTDGNHRMIYQELIMKYLIWLDIPETGSYDIIKKIAKKKFKEPELEELKSKLLNGWRKRVGRDEGFKETWTVVEQAARYSFNASHSLSYAYDSLYGAYLKSHYPLDYYTVALNYYANDGVRTLKLTNELSAFGIELKPIKFRYSQGQYSLSRSDNSIYKGIASISYMGEDVANEINTLKDNDYDTFIDLLYDIDTKTSLDSRQIRILIELDFFSEFGDTNYLLKCKEVFDTYCDNKQIKKQKLAEDGISEELVRPYAEKETEKMFSNINMRGFIVAYCKTLQVPKRTMRQRIESQIENLGYVDIVGEEYSGMAVVVDLDTKYSPRVKLYSLKNGTTIDCKIDKKTFNKNKLKLGDTIRIIKSPLKHKNRKNENGDWEPIPDQLERWITEYKKVEL